MRERERPAPDSYWNDDRVLARLRLGRADRLIKVRSHIEPEQYRGIGSETLFSLSTPTGRRTYVQSRLYFYAPPDTGRVERLADAQAWFYPSEASLVLWELIPASPVWQPNPDPREDFILRRLWLAYERFLIQRFSTATRLLTTWEDEYGRDDWQGFLTTLSYHQTAPAGFTKRIARPEGPRLPNLL